MARVTQLGNRRRARLHTGRFDPAIAQRGGRFVTGVIGGGDHPSTTTHITPGQDPVTVTVTDPSPGSHPSIVRHDPTTGASTPSYVPQPHPGPAPFAPETSLVSLGASAARSVLSSLLGGSTPAAPTSPLAPAVPTPLIVPPALEKKTLGSPSLEELLEAGQEDTLDINRAGKLTTPRVRRANRSLAAARADLARTTGIQGITHGPEATAFAEELAKDTGLDPRFVGAWVQSEGGGFSAGGEAGKNNWLGVGYPGEPTAFGRSQYFAGSGRAAGRATADWIKGKIGHEGYGYGAAPGVQAILPRAAGKGPIAALNALEQSGWGTDTSAVAQNLGSISARSNPQAQRAFKVAARNARDVGLNPTPFNGDVERGGRLDSVFVRADAQGMVHWAESAVGTPEGSGKQQRWAANFGLGTSEPWCANFVGAGLQRRGVEPPANPNYSGSYLDPNWKGGTQIGTDLAKAKPGDLLVFGSNEHIGLYAGNGEVIAGNYGDEVARYPVSDDSRGVSGIVRPHYKGGKVAVHESTPLPGSTPGSTFGIDPSGVAPGGVGIGGAEATLASQQAQAAPLAELAPPLAAGPVLASAPQPGGEASQKDLLALLGESSGLRSRVPRRRSLLG